MVVGPCPYLVLNDPGVGEHRWRRATSDDATQEWRVSVVIGTRLIVFTTDTKPHVGMVVTKCVDGANVDAELDAEVVSTRAVCLDTLDCIPRTLHTGVVAELWVGSNA
jgi:hypothetical protein